MNDKVKAEEMNSKNAVVETGHYDAVKSVEQLEY